MIIVYITSETYIQKNKLKRVNYMDKGWLKIHRTLLEKPIWTAASPEQKVVLITLLMMANHSEKQWEWKGKSYAAQPGQFITSLPMLVQKCGKNISVQKIRTALKRFVHYEFLTDESTSLNRLITIVNWDFYQRLNEMATEMPTDGQQATNRRLTPNKNVKNVKNEKNSNHRKQVYDESSIFYQLAGSLFESIKMKHRSKFNYCEIKNPSIDYLDQRAIFFSIN